MAGCARKAALLRNGALRRSSTSDSAAPRLRLSLRLESTIALAVLTFSGTPLGSAAT